MTFSTIKQLFIENQSLFATLFGVLGQYINEENKNRRFLFNLVWSSALVAVYLMPIFLEYLHIDKDSNLAIGLYAMSPMVSIQATAFLAQALRGTLRSRFLKAVGLTEKDLRDANN